MVEVFSFLRINEPWIYTIVGLFAAWQVWKFLQAWNEMRAAAFGLEREKAQVELNSAAVWLLLCLLITAIVFYLVNFVVPTIPEANPIPTPTLNLLATPTPDLSTSAKQTPSTTITPIGTLAPMGNGACISDTVMITSPLDGSQVKGIIAIEGSADIPNFGFYKYEIARPGDAIWLSINAGRQRVNNGKLGDWDTRSLTPEEYLLRLVVIDNEGNLLEPCIIRVRVLPTDDQP